MRENVLSPQEVRRRAPLRFELLKSMGSFDVTHVPYKESAQALPDLIANQVQMMQLCMPQTLTYLKSGQLKAPGVGSAKRLAALPDVPTIAEGPSLSQVFGGGMHPAAFAREAATHRA
jgi:tripartite-type tricarboxylate transporter receptor subunit TctC